MTRVHVSSTPYARFVNSPGHYAKKGIRFSLARPRWSQPLRCHLPLRQQADNEVPHALATLVHVPVRVSDRLAVDADLQAPVTSLPAQLMIACIFAMSASRRSAVDR